MSRTTSTSKVAPQLIATRFTQRNKREAKGRPSFPPARPAPQPESIRRVCGTPVSPGRRYCSECDAATARERMVEIAKVGRVASHAPAPEARRAETQRRHALAKKAWQPSSLPAWLADGLLEAATIFADVAREAGLELVVNNSQFQGTPGDPVFRDLQHAASFRNLQHRLADRQAQPRTGSGRSCVGSARGPRSRPVSDLLCEMPRDL